MSPLVLASASPRRAEILRALGIAFVARASKVDEAAIAEAEPPAFAREAARLKALDVAAQAGPLPYVLAADTVVDVDGELLGKPRNDIDSQRMVKALAGRDHQVHTAVSLARGDATLGELLVSTRVWFRSLSGGTIASYVSAGEGRDKAGAYAVQGMAAGFVERIEGSYSNVVGLPASQTVELLVEHGVLASWP